MEQFRNSATQETAYYRSKLAAYEAGAQDEVSRASQSRINELEKQVATLARERTEQSKQLAEVSSQLAMQKRIAEHAEQRTVDAIKRADVMTDSHDRALQERAELQERNEELNAALRDHGDRLMEQTSRLEQLEAEHSTYQSITDELEASRKQHVKALEQVQSAMAASSSRYDEMEAQWRRARERINQLEVDLTDAREEAASRTSELESTRQRLEEVENLWTKSREEADALRALTSTGLADLLDGQRQQQDDQERLQRGHAESVQALEVELASLRLRLKEANQRSDDVQDSLGQAQRRVLALESEQASLRTQLIGLRAQLTGTLAESGNLKQDLSTKETELLNKSKQAADAELRLTMLRNYFAEEGVVIDEDNLRSTPNGDPSARVMELENRLNSRLRMQQEAERNLEVANRKREEAERQAQQLSNQLDRIRSSQSPSNRSDGDGQWQARAQAAEQKLVDTEQSYRSRMQQMEDDYQLAVKYVRCVCLALLLSFEV
jgi:chromosome segregation ATPase